MLKNIDKLSAIAIIQLLGDGKLVQWLKQKQPLDAPQLLLSQDEINTNWDDPEWLANYLQHANIDSLRFIRDQIDTLIEMSSTSFQSKATKINLKPSLSKSQRKELKQLKEYKEPNKQQLDKLFNPSAALSAAEHHLLLQFLERIPGNFYIKDKHGNILYCNKQQREILGAINNNSLQQKTVYDLFNDKVANRLDEIDQEVLSNQQPVAYTEIGYDKYRLLEEYISYKTPIYGNADQAIAILGVSFPSKQALLAHNPSEPKSKRIAFLEKQITILNHILDEVPGNLYWIDKNHTYIGCNKNILKKLDIKRDKFIGSTIHDLFNENIAQPVATIDERIMTTGIVCTCEEHGPNDELGPTYYLSTKKPLIDKGKIIGMLGLSFDITQRKRIESKLRDTIKQLEIANNVKNDFITNMSHDIRTPSSGILGLLQMLQETNLDAYQKSLIDDINSSSLHLMQVLNNIILATHKPNQQEVSFSLSDMADEIMAFNQAKIKEKHINCSINIDHLVPDCVKGYRHNVFHVLLNLFGNALKFTEHGQIIIDIKVISQTSSDVTISISVKDTGPGIAIENQQIIFEKIPIITASIYWIKPRKWLRALPC